MLGGNSSVAKLYFGEQAQKGWEPLIYSLSASLHIVVL